MAGAGSHETPANLSSPRLAIWLESSAWSAARKLTQNLPERWIAGQAREVLAGMKSTSGGLSETDENDWQVRPTGAPPLIAVTTVTPGGEPAEHVAELAGGGDRLGVVGVDEGVLARAELEVVHRVAEPGLDEVVARPGLARVVAHPLGDSPCGSLGSRSPR